MVKTHVTPKMRKRSQALRRQLTPSEALLWNELRDLRKMHDIHFRRQSPIGPYIADFVCFAARLIVEVDGDSHETTAGKRRDQKRDVFFASQSFRVMRFSNPDVKSNAWQCSQEILVIAKELIGDPTQPANNSSRYRRTESVNP